MRVSSIMRPDGNRTVLTSSPAGVPDSIPELLRQLVAEVKGLRADLVRERGDDVQFVTTIAASVQGRVFSIMELREHARVDPNLQRAIGDFSNQRLGKRLRDLAGCNVGGFMVQRVGRDEHGVVWSVSATPDLHAGAGISAERGV